MYLPPPSPALQSTIKHNIAEAEKNSWEEEEQYIHGGYLHSIQSKWWKNVPQILIFSVAVTSNVAYKIRFSLVTTV